MVELGENISGYKNIDLLTGASPEEIKAQLVQIKLPYKLIAIYSQGSNHVAWIVPTQPIQKTKKPKG